MVSYWFNKHTHNTLFNKQKKKKQRGKKEHKQKNKAMLDFEKHPKSMRIQSIGASNT
jgi:hypothetical protein